MPINMTLRATSNIQVLKLGTSDTLVRDTTTTAVVGSTPEPGNCPAGWEAYGTSCFLFEPDLHLVGKIVAFIGFVGCV